jgi:cysteine synthase
MDVSAALPPGRLAMALVAAAVAGVAAGAALAHVLHGGSWGGRRKRDDAGDPASLPPLARAMPDLIGRTPLVRIASLSALTGCEILAKVESANPGGSSKDRVALRMIRDAQAAGSLRPGGVLVEGTSGSTGISLALLARALGYGCWVVMPDDQAAEKAALLRTAGAVVTLVKPASIVNPHHYVNVARRVADAINAGRTDELRALLASAASSDGCAQGPPFPTALPTSALFCDQFETPSNFAAHAEGTGPEIWAQTGGRVDAFVMGAGTGGTLAGVGAALKARRPGVRVLLADPPGSCLYNRVAHGVAFAPQQAEARLRRHRYDTVVEGVGIDRLTANFTVGLPHIDGAYAVGDAEAVGMSWHVLACDGLLVGSSSALNLVGAVRAAADLGPGHVVVTLLCDSGLRHLSRFWNDAYLAGAGLPRDVCESALAALLAPFAAARGGASGGGGGASGGGAGWGRGHDPMKAPR